jgi:hypothetical protein
LTRSSSKCRSSRASTSRKILIPNTGTVVWSMLPEQILASYLEAGSQALP